MAGQPTFLLDLGIFAISALALSLVFVRFRLPVVAGQILAGMLVGPFVFGLVNDTAVIDEISQIGVVLLLFIIGLELDPLQLRKVAGEVLVLSLLEMGVAFVFCSVAAFLLRLDVFQSVVFSLAGTITSTAIAGKIFLERRSLHAGESTILMGLLIVEDVVAVGFLTFLSSTTAPGATGNMTAQFLQTILGGLGLLVLAYVVGRYASPYAIDYLSSYVAELEEIPFLFALGLGFVFAILAAYFGYSPGTGAFIIGLSIRGKQSRFLSERLGPIKDLFLVLFFVSMGSLINPLPAVALGATVVVALILVGGGKFLAGLMIGNVLRRRHSEEITERPSSFGAWLIPRGEFSFVIGQSALALGIIDNSLFSLIGLVVLATALAGPLLQRLAVSKTAESEHPTKPLGDPE